jgi:hypothetical protein
MPVGYQAMESALHNQDDVGRIIAKVEGGENVSEVHRTWS